MEVVGSQQPCQDNLLDRKSMEYTNEGVALGKQRWKEQVGVMLDSFPSTEGGQDPSLHSLH
jgi:hypothetical protein